MPTVPLKLVLGVAIALVAITTGIIGFVPTYLEGVDAATEVVTLVRRTAVDLASERTISFFTYPLKTLQALEISINNSVYNLLDPPRNLTVRDYGQVLCDFILKDPNSVTRTVAIYVPSVEYFSFCDGKEIIPGVKNYLIYYNRQTSSYDVYLTVNEAVLFDFSFLSLPGSYAELLTYSGYVQTIALPPTYRWTKDLIGGIGTFNMVVGFKAPDKSGRNAKDVVVHMDISTDSLESFLKELDLGEGYRAMIIHRSSRLALGTSWYEPALDVVTSGANISTTNKTISDFKDSTVSAFIQHFGGEDGFYGQQFPYSGKTKASGDTIFIDAVHVEDGYGLDLILVILLKEKDYLEGIYRSRSIVIGAVAAAVALMAILGVIFAFLLVRPIERVARRMELTSQLQDEEESEVNSGLSEVRRMQVSYSKMKDQLAIMKKFLPPSVLNELIMGATNTDTDDTDEELQKRRKAAREVQEGVYEESEFDEGILLQSNGGDPNDNSGLTMSVNEQSVRSYTLERENMTHSMTYDRSTTVSATSRRRDRVMRTLNLTASLATKRISVVCFNVSGWHDFVRRKNIDGIASSYSVLLTKYIEGINRRVKENKGVVDVFQGDHVFASFNAVNVLATHPRRSVSCAFDAQKDFANGLFGLDKLQITAGVSVGTAIVGNAGTNDMMKFTITGQCYSEAAALERFARTFRSGCPRPPPGRQEFVPTSDAAISYSTPYTLTPILVSGSTMQETENDFLYQIVDIIELSRVTEARRRRGVIASVERSARGGGNADEWMYTLQNMTAANPFSTVNNAFRAILRGEVSPAEILHTMEAEVADRAVGAMSLQSSISVGIMGHNLHTPTTTTHFHVPASMPTPPRASSMGAPTSPLFRPSELEQPAQRPVDMPSPSLGNSLSIGIGMGMGASGGIRVLPVNQTAVEADVPANNSSTSWGVLGRPAFDAAGQAQIKFILSQFLTPEDMLLYARVLK